MEKIALWRDVELKYSPKDSHKPYIISKQKHIYYTYTFKTHLLYMGIQIANIDIQIANIGIQIANIGIQIANIGIQIANIGIQIANIGILIANIGIQMAF